MTDATKKQAEEIADLKAEQADLKAEPAELKAKVSPPKSDFVPMSDAEWIDKMHQMREGRMNYAHHPSLVHDMAGGVTPGDMADILRTSHAPQSPTGAIPSSQQRSNIDRGGASATPGWVDPTPLGPPPGMYRVDEQCIADAERQRAELKRKLGG